jgi:hypothetical protein
MSRNVKAALCYWSAPGCALLAGVGYLAAEIMGGQTGEGFIDFGVMVVFAVALVLGSRRSETLRGLMDQRDERIALINVKATAASGGLVIVATVVGLLVEVARGHSGAPYTWLAAIAGIGYIIAVVVERARR